MKKYILLPLSLILLFMLCACQRNHYQNPVTFYYPAQTMEYDADAAGIIGETREGSDFSDITDTLKAYLQGPQDSALYTPFPQELSLQNISWVDDTLYLTFSSHLGQLSGLDLTIACCCIARTTLELTNATDVVIQAQDTLLGGEKFLTFTLENVLTVDGVTSFVGN